MVRLSIFRTALAAVALMGLARPALSAPLTGNVEVDFATEDVFVINDRVNDVSQPQWMTDRGWITGWNMKDLRTRYEVASDTLYVGVNFLGIAGDVDGNGDPSAADPMTLSTHGTEMAHLSGRESITVAIDTDLSGKPDLVAGVPADKAKAGTGLNGFKVAKYDGTNQGIQFSYGETLANHQGGLAFDPSAVHPDFIFTITNFSKLPGLNLENGFAIQAYAGSSDDVIVGEDHIALTTVPSPLPQNLPEPATVVSWTLVGGLGAWRYRRRRASA